MKLNINTYIKPLFLPVNRSAYEIDCVGGRGRGGSHNVTLYIFNEITKPEYFRGYLMRAVHGDIRNSLWRDLNDRIEEQCEHDNYNYWADFHINDTRMEMQHIPTGNMLLSKGFKKSMGSQTAKMKSIAGATHVIIEETEEIEELDYNQMADSLRTVKAPVKIIRIWNPPQASHWLIRNYYTLLPSEIDDFSILEPKDIDNHLSIFGTYLNNLKFLDKNTVRRYENYQESNPEYYYNQILGMVSDGGIKKIYKGWKEIDRLEFDKLPYTQYFGLDFGEVAPTALVECKYNDGNFYFNELIYKPEREMDSLPKEIAHYGVEKGSDLIVCDDSGAEKILELQAADYYATGAIKGNVKPGISFLNKMNVYYTNTSTNIKMEYDGTGKIGYEGYQWEVDRYGLTTEKPLKKNDHLMDAMRYIANYLKWYLEISV